MMIWGGFLDMTMFMMIYLYLFYINIDPEALIVSLVLLLIAHTDIFTTMFGDE